MFTATLFQFIYAGSPFLTKSFSLTVGAGTRLFTEKEFKDSYDTTPLTYNIDLAWRCWNSVEIFVHTDYLKVDGLTSFTAEKTTLTIIPVELGLRYNVAMKKSQNQRIYPYLGGGAGYYMVKEETFFGTTDQKRVGFFIEGGIKFYFAGAIFLDGKVKNIFLTSENDTNLGGMAIMGGLGISF